MILRCWLLLLTFFFSSFSPVYADSPKDLTVVTTIRPLHSLLGYIMQGAGEPRLLLDQNQSPHHFSLRPSQRSTLGHADLVFWMGESLEAFMPRVLAAIPDRVKVVRLLDNPKLLKLEPRSASQHHGHGHSGDSLDPHLWLSVKNANEIARHMATSLSELDPAHAKLYQSNLKTLTSELHKLEQQISNSKINRTVNYLVYHDAFQYFEKQLSISPLAAISDDEEQAPGIKRLSFINKLIAKNKVNCIIFNTQTMPAVARNLVAANNIKTVFIDPTGQSLTPAPSLYFHLMQQIISGYQQCGQ